MAADLQVVRWADDSTSAETGSTIEVMNTPGVVGLKHSEATGTGLVTNGRLGIDRIHLEAGQGFVPHTHPGDHILIVIHGRGTITFGGEVIPTHPGQLYMVPGEVAHAVGARTDHVILAVGSPHKAVDDPERMAPIEYQEVISREVGNMHCLACEEETGVYRSATFPGLLHEAGCSHCPCFFCVSTGDPQEDAELQETLRVQRLAPTR